MGSTRSRVPRGHGAGGASWSRLAGFEVVCGECQVSEKQSVRCVSEGPVDLVGILSSVGAMEMSVQTSGQEFNPFYLEMCAWF